MNGRQNNLGGRLETLSVISRRRFLHGAAAGMALPALAGLAQRAKADEPKRGGHLILGIDGASTSDNVDPALYLGIFTQVVGQSINNTLVEIDEKMQAQPALATAWEPNANADTWVIKLRPGVSFHNGKEMTADDVLHSLQYHRQEGSKSPAKVFLASVVEITASGKYEVTVKLDAGNADFPFILGDYHLVIGPSDAPFDKGIGTGPYMLESFQPGVLARLTKNRNYWNPERGFVDSVEVVAINDPSARIFALKSGTVHLINQVPPKLVSRLAADPTVQVFESAAAAHYALPMRCDTAPFDNNDVRLAIKYSIDREGILAKILNGHGRIANDQPIPDFDPFFADLPQRQYDPDKARFHFQKSGYSGPVVLSVSDVAFAGCVDTAVLIKESAAKAGIDVEVDSVPADGFWENTWMKKPWSAAYWDGRPTADLMFSLLYKSNAAWNDTFWQRPDFDKILVEARSELDVGKRRDMYRELQTMIVEDGGQIIPVFNNFIDAGASSIKGFVPMPTHSLSGWRAVEKVWIDA
ncbi:MAG TPA: ABC transporter substrate-binding protein [Nordella sp.]|nr:ABC transporter substrate-binding protein [Nordella sp.]